MVYIIKDKASNRVYTLQQNPIHIGFTVVLQNYCEPALLSYSQADEIGWLEFIYYFLEGSR